LHAAQKPKNQVMPDASTEKLETIVMPRTITRGQSPWTDIRELLGREPELVFDVGANEGDTAWQIRSSFPQARILCFEPVTVTFRKLRENTQNWQALECFNFGFSQQKCTKTLFLQKESGWNSIAHNINCGLGSQEIALETLDSFCNDRNVPVIDVLKTDTEGHDLHVLQGASALLRDGRINAVLTECGFYKHDTQHTYFCDILRLLQDNSYQFYGIYNVEPALRYIPHHKRPDYPYPDVLFVRDKLVVDKFGKRYEEWLHQLGFATGRAKEF
jgi:FkbM family methyltransferase